VQLRDDYERFTALGAEVLAISAEPPQRSEAYLRSHPLPYPTLISLGQRPGLFVIDSEGVVRFEEVGAQQYNIPPNEKVLGVLESL
jgi:peroxiredoxin